eukprot:1454663-Amphidinium_carterae.1
MDKTVGPQCDSRDIHTAVQGGNVWMCGCVDGCVWVYCPVGRQETKCIGGKMQAMSESVSDAQRRTQSQNLG